MLNELKNPTLFMNYITIAHWIRITCQAHLRQRTAAYHVLHGVSNSSTVATKPQGSMLPLHALPRNLTLDPQGPCEFPLPLYPPPYDCIHNSTLNSSPFLSLSSFLFIFFKQMPLLCHTCSLRGGGGELPNQPGNRNPAVVPLSCSSLPLHHSLLLLLFLSHPHFPVLLFLAPLSLPAFLLPISCKEGNRWQIQAPVVDHTPIDACSHSSPFPSQLRQPLQRRRGLDPHSLQGW